MKTRQETLIDELATIIQRGYVEQQTSYEIAEAIDAHLEAEAEEWRNRPGPGEEP